MTTTWGGSDVGHAILAIALLGAFTPVRADDADDYARLTQPASNVSVGASAASGDSRDRAIFGQYNGRRDHDLNLLLDFDYVRRDDRTGTWTIVRGRDLGLDTPELAFTLNRQGEWKIAASYDEIVKHDIRTINTGISGAGTTTPKISLLGTPGTGQDENLELKRQRLGLNVDKWLTPSLQMQVSFKNEDKSGAVQWGRGFACTSGAAPGCLGGSATRTGFALLLLPQPVDSRTDQVEAKLNFHTKNLFLSGGYYGSFYVNNNGTLTPGVPGTLNNGLGVAHPLSNGLQGILNLPMALWPDNQAHQFYLDGTYAFTPKVRSSFHLAYTHATQDESFGAMGLAGAPAGVGSLNGERNTTLGQLGLTARPLQKLSVLANLRYEDRSDKTPLEYYNIEGTVPAGAWTNDRSSYRKVGGKLEGTYELLSNLRGTLGIDYESINRDLPMDTAEVGGITALRQKTDETSYRAQLRRTFSDQFAGSVSLVHASRTGSSDWYYVATEQMISGNQLSALQPAGGAIPVYLLDRKRDKARLTAEWTPTQKISLQAVVEDGRDRFNAPIYTGMQSADARLYSLDGSFALTSKWKLTAYVSRTDQSMFVEAPSTSSYQIAFRDLEDAIGIGVTGKSSSRLDVGANLSYINDRNIYRESLGPAASAANANFLASSGGLPDVIFRELRLNLFGKYALDKSAVVRVDLIHQRDKLNDWTWGYAGVPFTYADNTTVTLNPDQRVTVLMGRYIYTFR